MTFLQPFILFGLAAAAIPLVLHLLTLRRLRTIEFSTLAFLKELQKSRIRKLRLRQWLLLLLRTLLVLLLVLAFARPTLQGTLPEAWGEAAHTSAVILLDDSYSMTAVDGRGELLRQARDAATGVLRSLRDGDEASVIPLSEAVDPSSAAPTRILPLLMESAANMRPSAVRQSLETGIRTAAAVLASTRNANKELYVLSDFQKTLLGRSDQAPFATLNDPAVRMFAVPLGDRPPANVSIERMRFPGSLVNIGRPFSVEASLANRGSAPVTAATVSLFLGAERMDQRARDLLPEASQDVALSAVPRQAGFLTARVEVEGDDLEFDNVRHVALRIRKEIKLLLVGTDEDLRYVRLALQTRVDSAAAFLRIESVTPDRLTESRLTGPDAVIVAAGHPTLDRWATRLRTLAEQGTGLIILPAATAGSWGAFGAALGLGSATLVVAPGGSFLTFGSEDIDHPVFEGMFSPPSVSQRERPRVPSPDIQRYLPVSFPPASVAVVTLSDGRPFLVEMPVGAGRALILTSACTPAWSNLPVQGLFVPLLHRCVAVVTGAQDIRPTVTVGSEVVLPIPAGMRGAARITRPDRQVVAVVPTSHQGGTVVRYDGTRVPGVYSLSMEGQEVDRFAVTVDDRETDTRTASEEERVSFFASVGVPSERLRTLKSEPSMERIVQEARLGTELWRILLLAALAVATAEILIASRLKPETSPRGIV